MSSDRTLRQSDSMYLDHPIIRSRPRTCIWMVQIHGVKASIGTAKFLPNGTSLYIWMRSNQRYRDVQMDGSGTFKWTLIQIDTKSLLIWTVQLEERPNKHSYTVNLARPIGGASK